jgi:hypothetical protein
MIRTVAVHNAVQSKEESIKEVELRSLFSSLFVGNTVWFFDAESDEDFINVFDHIDTYSLDERRVALENFRHDLRLEENYIGDYGRMSEILIQSEDFLDNIAVPFLMFNLTCEEDKDDPAYSFGLDLFEVFCIGSDRFLVSLHMRNGRQSHMEIYMRFTRSEAIQVVDAILRVFEDYMAYPMQESPIYGSAESGLEEMLTDVINGADTPQLNDSRESIEAKFKQLRIGN